MGRDLDRAGDRARAHAWDGAAWAWAPDRTPPIRRADHDAPGARYLSFDQGLHDRKVELRDVASGALIQSWTLPDPGLLGSVHAWIAGSGDRAIAWSKGRLYWCVVGRRKQEPITDELVDAPVFGPDGDAVLDAATGALVARLPGLPDPTFHIAAYRGSRGVAATTRDGRAAAWDLAALRA